MAGQGGGELPEGRRVQVEGMHQPACRLLYEPCQAWAEKNPHGPHTPTYTRRYTRRRAVLRAASAPPPFCGAWPGVTWPTGRCGASPGCLTGTWEGRPSQPIVHEMRPGLPPVPALSLPASCRPLRPQYEHQAWRLAWAGPLERRSLAVVKQRCVRRWQLLVPRISGAWSA